MKKIFTLIAVAAMALAAQAETLEVCAGGGWSSMAPVYGFYYDSENTETQMIYPADMLTNMVGATITQVKFYADGMINFEGGKIQMSMGMTDQLSFDTQEFITSGLTAVATTVPEKGSTTLVFDLDQPFVYTGGNLVIECLVAETGSYASTYFVGVQTEYYASLNYYYWWWDSYTKLDFLPMASFSYEPGSTPVDPPVEPTEKTQTPDGMYQVVPGQHEVLVTITGYEGDVFYRVIYTDAAGNVTEGEWTPYVDAFSVYDDGRYRVEFYAVAPGKLPSDPGAVEFTVTPMTGIEEMTTGKTVAAVRYFNMAGQEMQQPAGVTIMVTTYTDGSVTTAKVVK